MKNIESHLIFFFIFNISYTFNKYFLILKVKEIMVDKGSTNSNYLIQERVPLSKPFSMELNDSGKSVRESFESHPEFRTTDGLYKKCLIYATAYTETMLSRAKIEDPEIFAVKGMSKPEMQMHLIHNMCLPMAKLNAAQYRRTIVD